MVISRERCAALKRASHQAVTLRKILLSAPTPEEVQIPQVGMAKEEVQATDERHKRFE